MSKTFITDDLTRKVFVSLYTYKEPKGFGLALKHKLREHGVWLLDLSYTRDTWARDYMPVEIFRDEYLSFRYRPTYIKTEEAHKIYDTDWRTVRMVDRIKLGEKLNVHDTELLLDGGNIVKAIDRNGKPCFIMTDKVLTDNAIDKSELQRVITQCTDGAVDVVLIPWEGNCYEGGEKDNPIGHSDGVVRYLAPGKLLMTNLAEYEGDEKTGFCNRVKESLADRFDVIELKYDGVDCLEHQAESWSYINFLQIGKLIILPSMKCDYDQSALRQITEHFKAIDEDYVVDMIDYNMTDIIRCEDIDDDEANGGGALNCLTWTI